MPQGIANRAAAYQQLHGNILSIAPANATVYQLTSIDSRVLMTTPGAAENAEVKMPNPSEMAGRFVSLRVITAGTGSIDVIDEAGVDIKAGLDAANDFVLLFSDGSKWLLATDGVA